MEQLYDWSTEDITQYIDSNSNNDFLYIKFTWQQLGLTEEWYRKECRALTNSQLLIRRELDLEWTKSSDNSVFEEEQLDAVSIHMQTDPVEIRPLDASNYFINDVVHEKFLLRIYKHLDPNKIYFVGVDTAGGTSADNSAFNIVDPLTKEVYATFKNSKISTTYFKSLLINLIKKELPNSILVIERNNYGKPLIDDLVKIIPDNLFYDYKLQDKEKDKMHIHKDSITYGINTTESSRNKMIDLLYEVVIDEPKLVAIPEIYHELKTLVFTSSGKIEHEKGCHDDSVFAYMFVIYALATANTLGKFLRNSKMFTENANAVSSTKELPTIASINTSVKSSNIADNISLMDYVRLTQEGKNIADYMAELAQKSERTKNLVINKTTLNLLS